MASIWLISPPLFLTGGGFGIGGRTKEALISPGMKIRLPLDFLSQFNDDDGRPSSTIHQVKRPLHLLCRQIEIFKARPGLILRAEIPCGTRLSFFSETEESE